MNRKIIGLAGVIAALGLAGCANYQPRQRITWDKPGATTQEFAQAKLQCVQTAYSSVPGFTAMGGLMMVAIEQAAHNNQQKEVFNLCMEAAGYTPIVMRP